MAHTRKHRRAPSEAQKEWIEKVLELPAPSTFASCDTFITYVLEGAGKPDEDVGARVKELREFWATYYGARVRFKKTDPYFRRRMGEVVGLIVRSKEEIAWLRKQHGRPPKLYKLLVELYPHRKRVRVAPSRVNVRLRGTERRLC